MLFSIVGIALLAAAVFALGWFVGYALPCKVAVENTDTAPETEDVVIIQKDIKYHKLQQNIDKYDGTGRGQIDLE